MSKKTTEKPNMIVRPPVVCVLGHIDHGKSSLLDYIRKTSVVDKEVGGITQAISAYEVEHKTPEGKTRLLTFIDTPGHEAFEKMRRRGAEVADIAILVVSAEEGVKKQTLEAYEAIKAAKVPFIVAITKTDKPNADIERVKGSLAEGGIYLEGFGGDISYVPLSSKTGEGIKELLDILVLTADIGDFKGDISKPAEGFIIETTRDHRKGIYATLIIKDGKLSTGTYIVSGKSYAPVRMMENFIGKKIPEAFCGTPVGIGGWSEVPVVGDTFTTVDSKKEAETAAQDSRTKNVRKKEVEAKSEKKAIALVIKGDTLGSTEAITHEIIKITHERIMLRVLYSGIGRISESDVKALSSGSDNALILGFNVDVDAQAKALAERLSITIETFDIIYKLAEWLDAYLKEHSPKIEVEEIVGEAKIMRFFSRTKDRQIVGGKVLKGEIGVGHKIRIKRRDTVISSGVIKELQQQKNRTDSVKEGSEFGTLIEAKIEIAPGDMIEDFIIVEKQ